MKSTAVNLPGSHEPPTKGEGRGFPSLVDEQWKGTGLDVLYPGPL